MRGFFRSRGGRDRPGSTPHAPTILPLRWIDLDAAATVDHPTVVDDIIAKRLDGVTVSGVFGADEAARAVAHLEHFRADRTDAMFGTVLGLPLAALPTVSADPDDRSIYLDDTERCRRLYREAFGFDPAERLDQVIRPLAGGRPLTTPSENGRPYNTGNVRWFEPGSRGLPAHVGNEFDMHESAALAHLRNTTVTHDHLSWFVILQAPDEGGALSVFDLLHDSHQPDQPNWTDVGRDDAEFDRQPAKRIAPPAGTLVLFGGGWRWHRVDPILGARQRITWGGFAGLSTDGATLNSWF